MNSWILVPSLVSLRSEFNELAPKRDKGADGSIGDTAHTSSSDHTPDEDSSVLEDHDADDKNEVHAVDIDSTGPWPRSFDSVIQDVIAGEKAKWLDEDDVCRLEYVIWDRKIYSRKRDFEPVAYTGSDPHTNHAHFSGRYITQAENDTRKWNVVKENALSASEVNSINNNTNAKVAALKADLTKEINAVASEVWNVKVGSKVVPTRTALQALADESKERAVKRFPASHAEAKDAGYPADSPLLTLFRQVDRIDDIEAKLDKLLLAVAALKA